MPKLTINGKEIEVAPGTTVMQACQMMDVEVPHFWYHERLDIAGNCRMCLVELENAPKPIASCAMPAADGMVIKTNSDMAEKARKGVMEFLLLNHPLDCPICDQGGECDLQDQAMAYGYDDARTKEMRRSVKDKYMGPLIKTIMTRCIHCTRCIRFIEDVAGVEELGATGRGEHMEVTTYVEKALTSEMSGNIIDLCPVGALTSKPYAFKARSWELKKTESIDVMDAIGANIRVDSAGNEVMRVLPRLHEDVNEEWISDKSRFSCDGLKRQRLDRPYIRKRGKLHESSWEEAFAHIAKNLENVKSTQIAALAGDLCEAESMYALKNLMASLGSTNIDCRTDGAELDAANRGSYLFNTTIAGIEEADACLIVGANPRYEAPLVQARLRKRYLRGGFEVGLIGEKVELTHNYKHLGSTPKVLQEVISGKNDFAKVLKKAKRPMIILGAHALTRPDAQALLALVHEFCSKFNLIKNKDGWNGFSVLHTAASRVGALDMGFVPGKGGKAMADILNGASRGSIKAVYLLNVDNVDMKKLKKAFVIYQGHHGDKGAQAADVVLPGAAYTEKDGIYTNMEGRVQFATRAVFPPGDAKEDWKIIRALSERLGHILPFNTLQELRTKLFADYPVFAKEDELVPAKWQKFGKKGKLSAKPFESKYKNFYMTDVVSSNSETMAKCTNEFYYQTKMAAE